MSSRLDSTRLDSSTGQHTTCHRRFQMAIVLHRPLDTDSSAHGRASILHEVRPGRLCASSPDLTTCMHVAKCAPTTRRGFKPSPGRGTPSHHHMYISLKQKKKTPWCHESDGAPLSRVIFFIPAQKKKKKTTTSLPSSSDLFPLPIG